MTRRRQTTLVLFGPLLLLTGLLFARVAAHPRLDLQVTLAAFAEPMVQVGQPVNYTVTVSNWGQEEAANIVVTHTLPLEFTYAPGSTAVEVNGQLLSSSDPLVDGQFLTWEPLTVPDATLFCDNPYGVHTFVQDLCAESYIDFQLDKSLELAGIGGHVTQLVYPVTATITGPQPCWVYFVNRAYDRHLAPILRIQGEWGGNYWVKPEPDSPGDYTSIAQAYKRVVEGLPRRDGHTLYVQVWNEPDVSLEWSGVANAGEYAHFFVDVAAAIHSIGDSRIQVLNGALTPGQVGFIKQLLGVPGFAESFDLWASHCYPFNHPPWYNIHSGTARNVYTIDCYVPELQVLATDGGRTGVNVLVTETGYALHDRTFRWFPAIDEINRAQYIAVAFRDYWVSWPEVVGVTPFELVDPYEAWLPWDWLYATSDLPHEQFNAVKALPKPKPVTVPTEATIRFRAQAADTPGTYYSDLSATAGGALISQLTGVAPVMVVDKVYAHYFPLVARDGSAAATSSQVDVVSGLQDEMLRFPEELDLAPAAKAQSAGPTVSLSSAEQPGEAPAVLSSISLGSRPEAMALDSMVQRAYVTLGGGNLVIVDLSEDRIVCTVPVGREPAGVGANPGSGLVYVANSGDGTVSVVDGSSCGVVTTVGGMSEPYGVAVDEVADRIYVTDPKADRLLVIDGESNEVVGRVLVGSSPEAIVLSPELDRLFVADSGDGTLLTIDPTSLEVLSTLDIAQGPLLGMAVDSRAGLVYVVFPLTPQRRGVAAVDASRPALAAVLTGGWDRPLSGTYAVTVDEDRGRLYIADGRELLVVDTRLQTLIASTPVGAVTYTFGLAVDTSTGRVYVLDYSRGALLVLAD